MAPPGEPCQSVEALLALMDRCNVQAAVLVPYLGFSDNRYLAESVGRYPKRFVGLAYVDWRQEKAVPLLKALAERDQFSGIRLETEARSPGRDPFLIWKAAFSLGLRISAQGGRSPAYWAGPLRAVLKQLPQLKVRIEHLARPRVEIGVNDPAFQSVLRLADFPQVVMNVDGLWAVSRTEGPYDDVWPFAEAAITAFGAERIMWGSDFPYLLEFESYSD